MRILILILVLCVSGCFGENTTRQLREDNSGKEAVKASRTEKDTTPFIGTTGNNSPVTVPPDVLERLARALEANRESKIEAKTVWDMSVSEFYQKVSGWFYLICAISFLIFVATAIVGITYLRSWLKGYSLKPLVDLARSCANGLAFSTKDTPEWTVWSKMKDKVHRAIVDKGGVPPT